MKRLLSLGLAVLLTLSLAVYLPIVTLAEDSDASIAEPTYTYDFSAYCLPGNYGFSNLADLTIDGGTRGYYTFTATEDEVGAGLDSQVYLPTPDVDVTALSCAVILYRTEARMRGEIFVDRTDDVIMGQQGSHAYWQYENDGEWHLALVDASAIWGDAPQDVRLRHFRFDPLALCEEGDSVDVSYIKFFASFEDASAYVAANSEVEGEIAPIDNVVEWKGKMYGYENKVAVNYFDDTIVSVQMDWDMSTALPSPNCNESLLMENVEVEDRDAVMKNGAVIAWAHGGYPTANHPLYAIHGQSGQYLAFDSLPFGDYDRVTVILTTSGSGGKEGEFGPDNYSMVVGFVSDTEKLYGVDIDNLNLEADIVHGICAPATEGQVNISGLGTGVSWNTRERAVTMDLDGKMTQPAALYIGSRNPHIPVVVKILFERDVEAKVYKDDANNEYVENRDVICEEEGVFYAYTDLLDVTATEVDGEVVYMYDSREYFGQAPAVPAAPTHTITFVERHGNVVATRTFTEGSTVVDWTEPEVPAREGFVGTWNTYESKIGGTEDFTVEPHYALAPVEPAPEENTTDAVDTETEELTTEVVEDATGATDDTTAAIVDTNKVEDTTAAPAAEGCKAVIASASILGVIALAAGAVICKKKD